MADHYDVVIAGAGIVGMILASGLANTKLKIAILDEQEPALSTLSDTYDLRVSAITQASENIFNNLGVWPAIVGQRVSPYQHMRISDAQGQGKIHFDARSIGQAHLGHIIENRVMHKALYEYLLLHSNINWHVERLVNLSQEKDRCLITTTKGKEIIAKLLVGADGAHSKVRHQLGTTVSEWEYGQHAVVATVQTTIPHQSTAWQRFLPSGPLAFLPLKDHYYCSVVWSTHPAEAQQLLKLSENEFCERLTLASADCVGTIRAVIGRDAYPLTMRHARRYTQDRVALIGDAAHTLHPLAGQGMNLGILDAACLAEVILTAFEQGNDMGSSACLRRYERWRKGHNLALIAMVEGFKRLFSNNLWPLVLLRNRGLSMVQRASSVKNAIMRNATGITGDLPLLAKAPRVK